MATQKYRVNSRQQRCENRPGLFKVGEIVTVEDINYVDWDGETWAVSSETEKGYYILPSALDPISETATPDPGVVPDVRWLNAALMALGADWEPTGFGILYVIDLAREIERAVNKS